MPSIGDDSVRDVNASTASLDYSLRLQASQSKWWKRLLPVQLPYRWNIRRLHLGRTLDVGCGLGRNLASLHDSVGVDHNETSVAIARAAGYTAFTVEEFAELDVGRAGGFDSLLFAHVLEHMTRVHAIKLLREYLPNLRPGGIICIIAPQERGYASDPTHVEFVDFDALRSMCDEVGLVVERSFSFPFPRKVGPVFPYNEFVVVARSPDGGRSGSI